MAVPPAEKPGLQIERTHLAWERTAIGYLAIAAIILFHQSGPLGALRTLLALLATALSIVVFGISRARGRIAVHGTPSGRSVVREPSVAVLLIGWGTALLALALLGALAFSS